MQITEMTSDGTEKHLHRDAGDGCLALVAHPIGPPAISFPPLHHSKLNHTLPPGRQPFFLGVGVPCSER